MLPIRFSIFHFYLKDVYSFSWFGIQIGLFFKARNRNYSKL